MINTKYIEIISTKNILSLVNTVIKGGFLGKVKHIGKEKRVISMLKSLVRENVLFFILGDPKYLVNACLSKRNDRFKEQVNLIHNKKTM